MTRRTGRCAECGFDYDDDHPERIVAIVRDAPRHFARATSRDRPAADVWSPLEYTVHTAAALGFYADRIELVVTHDRPQLSAFDFAAAADADRYNERDANDALVELAGAAARLASLVESLTPEHWQRVGIGSEGGERNVAMLARRAAHEVQHHALDVQRASG